jgi:hypothetical protein
MKRLVVCCLLVGAVIPARSQVASRATVQGIVLRGETDETVGDAVIAIGPRDANRVVGKMPDSTTSDSRGRFSFADLDAGHYGLTVTQTGYLQHRETRLNLAAGESLNNLIVRLTPTGTIAGRVLDESGQPIGDVPVRLVNSTHNGETTTRTNDRGEYRFYHLSPGQYWIAAGQPGPTSAVRSSGAVTRFPDEFELTYYPGVRDREASRLATVKSGEGLSEMNIVIGKGRPPANTATSAPAVPIALPPDRPGQ